MEVGVALLLGSTSLIRGSLKAGRAGTVLLKVPLSIMTLEVTVVGRCVAFWSRGAQSFVPIVYDSIQGFVCGPFSPIGKPHLQCLHDWCGQLHLSYESTGKAKNTGLWWVSHRWCSCAHCKVHHRSVRLVAV